MPAEGASPERKRSASRPQDARSTTGRERGFGQPGFAQPAGRHAIATPRRTILVSNRLPISMRVEHGELIETPSMGGLATGLRGFHERGNSVWIGWSGETGRLGESQRAELQRRFAELRLLPVEMSHEEVQLFYDRFANGVLWPLLHYQVDRLPLRAEGWETYRHINERFAEIAAATYRPGDAIWVHDYQLALVPGMLRQALPDAPIGFFWHVPFPSAEVFRVLPWRAQILEGMLGADLIGLHTVPYVLHLLTSAANVLGAQTRPGRVTLAGRTVRVGTFPMGIDFARFDRLGEEPEVTAEAELLRQSGGQAALIVSVDRLDYTKGIPGRMLAFERLLERYPELRGGVRLMQIAAPSRASVGEYRDFQRTVNETVGRINGRFAQPGYDPIHYISQTLTTERLTAFYRAAAVALVTPLRDGMNLVAKEFVAGRSDGDGVLVLSEFAGAAAELTGALLVNPFDVDAVATAIHDALAMPEEERRARMAGLREQVRTHDVHRWADQFLGELAATARRRTRLLRVRPAPAADQPADVANELLSEEGRPLILLLDYDGTLVGLRPTPGEASPDPEILRILAGLALLPAVDVHVISGRRRSDLELWLGNLPLGLHAEHGLWSRDARRGRWRRRQVETGWLEEARRVMVPYLEGVPGSAIELKEASVAWHYRNAPPEKGRRAASELDRRLREDLAGSSATVLRGKRVVEARDTGISKGLVVHELASASPRARMLIAGDDTTDEDMFREAPQDAVTVKVGPGQTRARMRLLGPDQVRVLLVDLLERLGATSNQPPESSPAAPSGAPPESLLEHSRPRR